MIEFKRHNFEIFLSLSYLFFSSKNNEMTPYSRAWRREKKQESSSLDQFNQSFASLNHHTKQKIKECVSEWVERNKLIICITTSNPSIQSIIFFRFVCLYCSPKQQQRQKGVQFFIFELDVFHRQFNHISVNEPHINNWLIWLCACHQFDEPFILTRWWWWWSVFRLTPRREVKLKEYFPFEFVFFCLLVRSIEWTSEMGWRNKNEKKECVRVYFLCCGWWASEWEVK